MQGITDANAGREKGEGRRKRKGEQNVSLSLSIYMSLYLPIVQPTYLPIYHLIYLYIHTSPPWLYKPLHSWCWSQFPVKRRVASGNATYVKLCPIITRISIPGELRPRLPMAATSTEGKGPFRGSKRRGRVEMWMSVPQLLEEESSLIQKQGERSTYCVHERPSGGGSRTNGNGLWFRLFFHGVDGRGNGVGVKPERRAYYEYIRGKNGICQSDGYGDNDGCRQCICSTSAMWNGGQRFQEWVRWSNGESTQSEKEWWLEQTSMGMWVRGMNR